MSIIEGMDNSVVFVFVIMGCLLIFLLYNILKFIIDKHSFFTNSLENNHNHQGGFENVEGECCICLQQYENRVSLLCNHTFCGINIL